MTDWKWKSHHIMPALREALAKFGRAVVRTIFKVAATGGNPGGYLRWLFRNWGNRPQNADTSPAPAMQEAQEQTKSAGAAQPDPIARAHKALKGGATLAAVNIIMQALDGLSLAAVQSVCVESVRRGLDLDEFRGAVLVVQ